MSTRDQRAAGPLVSVLTPSFEQVRWLDDNLRSVEAQTYASIEHLVFDGGSTDGSAALLAAHSRPGLRWQSSPDEGQSAALNRAFAAATGDIIGWLNSDDAYFAPDVVAAAVQTFEANSSVDVVYGHAALVNGEGLIIQLLWTPPFSRQLLRIHDFINQPAAFVRRSAIPGQLVDPKYHYAMDYELWLRLSSSHQFARLDRIIAIDRHHLGRKSYTWLDAARRDHDALRSTYGAARNDAASEAARRATKVALRYAAIPILGAALRESAAFGWRVDGLLPLARRQLVTRRRTMPVGEGTG